MIRILSKGMITKHFIPYLSQANRGFVSKIPLWEVVNAILYKLKTGVQWHLLPCKSLIRSNKIKYGAIYHHFNKWCKDGSWQKAWTQLLSLHKSLLDLSLLFMDGTHTPAKRGGESVAYQGRKKSKTSNTVWLTDRQGNIVGFLPPVSGNHNDLFELEKHLEHLIGILNQCGIAVDGLFLNADAGFYSKSLEKLCFKYGVIMNVPPNQRNSKHLEEYGDCFDELMYKERFVIERTNAWMDSCRTILNRFDTTWLSWNAWHYIFAMLSWIKNLSKV